MQKPNTEIDCEQLLEVFPSDTNYNLFIEGGEKSLKKKGWRSKRRVGGGSTSTSASSTGASSSSHAEPDSRSATISKYKGSG